MLPRFWIRILPALLPVAVLTAEPVPPARSLSIAPAINALGLDLYRQQANASPDGILLSPYSISSSLAMTYAGVDGATKAEMQKVLHLPADQTACSAAFHDLAGQLTGMTRVAGEESAARKHRHETTVLQLDVADRLFVQRGYVLRPDFIGDLQEHFAAGPELLDFKADPKLARQTINDWVAGQTLGRIMNLLPEGQPPATARLVLVNALYLRASWSNDFDEDDTKREPFHLAGGKSVPVPTMCAAKTCGYAKYPGYSVVTLPYSGGALQFVLLVPDEKGGLPAIEQKLTVAGLQEFTHLKEQAINLHLPRFTMAPSTLALGGILQSLGMKTAFDLPQGSANFDRMAPRRSDAYLYLGEVFHKTWLSLDEHGTEAAAATAGLVLMTFGVSAHPIQPIEVRADRPFLFAIQHVGSGACLFLGRVTDPR